MNRNSIQLKNILNLSVIKSIGLGLNFIIVALLISLLGKTDYGIWITVFSIINWIYSFDLGFGLGLRNKLTESLTIRNFNKSNQLISTTYFTVTFIAIIFLIIGISVMGLVNFNEFFNYNKKNSLTTFVFVSFSFTILNFIFTVYKNLFLSIHKSYIPELVNTIILFTFMIFILVYKKYSQNYSMTIIMFWFGFLNLIFSFAATIYFFRNNPQLKFSLKYFSRPLIKELINIGGGFFIIQISLIIIFSTDNLIISNLLGPNSVTDYSIVQKIFQIFIVVFALVLTPSWGLYIHAIAKNDVNWIKNNIKTMLVFFSILLVLAFIVLININFIIDLWVGAVVTPPKYLAVLFFIFTILFSFSNIFMYFINATGKIQLQTKLYVLGAIINIPLSILFVNIFKSSNGVIIATIISILPLIVFMPIQYFKILEKLKNNSKIQSNI